MTLYMMAGLPGSGKSFLSRALYKKLTEDGVVVTIIQSDVVRHSLFPTPCYEGWEHQKVFGEIHKRIDDALLINSTCILDCTNRMRFERKVPQQIANKYGANILLIHVIIDEATARERLVNRGSDENMSDAGFAVYERMALRQFQEPSNPYLTLNGTDDVNENVQKILEWKF